MSVLAGSIQFRWCEVDFDISTIRIAGIPGSVIAGSKVPDSASLVPSRLSLILGDSLQTLFRAMFVAATMSLSMNSMQLAHNMFLPRCVPLVVSFRILETACLCVLGLQIPPDARPNLNIGYYGIPARPKIS